MAEGYVDQSLATKMEAASRILSVNARAHHTPIPGASNMAVERIQNQAEAISVGQLSFENISNSSFTINILNM